MKKYQPLILPVVFILLAFVLFWATSIPMCGGCTGWNAINPLCYAALAVCGVWSALFNTILIIGAIALLITGIWRLRKVKI